LGLAACQKGYRVRFTTAASLAHELIEAKDERRLMRFQKMLSSFELLIIDELGFVPLSKTGAELLFEVFSRRYERSATLVTSNLPLNEWTEAFGSERSPYAPSAARRFLVPKSSSELFAPCEVWRWWRILAFGCALGPQARKASAGQDDR